MNQLHIIRESDISIRDTGASVGRPAFFHGHGTPTLQLAGVYPGSNLTIPLVPPALRAPGDSGDWINEIHLTRSGLKKFSPQYAALVEQVLQTQGLPE